jgi:hypothetical protein
MHIHVYKKKHVNIFDSNIFVNRVTKETEKKGRK